MGSSLIQQLYNTVDLMFVGNIVGKEASAAVGSTSLLTVCILGFFMGMGVGVGVITAHAFGARQDKALKNTIHTAIGLAIALSVVATAIGLAICPFFLKWMHVPKHITGLALTYIRLYLLGMFAIVCYNVATGIIRALGNARSPLIYAIIGGLVNVGADALLMSVFRMGITGAALATVLSQALSAALALRYLCRLPDRWRLELRKITIDWALTRRIMRLAIPEAIRSMLMTFANILIQTGINGLGVSSMAAYAAYGKVEGFIYFPQWSVGQANTTFVSQNLGAGNLKRTERSTKVALAMGIGITLITSGIAILAAYPIFRAFSADPWVIEISVRSARAAYGTSGDLRGECMKRAQRPRGLRALFSLCHCGSAGRGDPRIRHYHPANGDHHGDPLRFSSADPQHRPALSAYPEPNCRHRLPRHLGHRCHELCDLLFQRTMETQ